MNTLSDELKSVITRRLERARPSEIIAIASALCAPENEARAAGVDPAMSNERFRATDYVVVHHETGLMWSRASVPGGRMSWQDAEKACAELSLGGFEDWRMPTIRELLTLVDYERHDPAIDPVFECEAAWYWTSTPAAPSPGDCAWIVKFDYGDAYWYYHYYGGFVRAVRPGQ